MGNFAILHFEKVKSSTDMANVAGHNSREKIIDSTGGWKNGKPPDWMENPQNEHLNEGHMGTRSESVGKTWNRTIKEAGLKRAPQKNASRAIEAIFSATNGAFSSNDEWRKYLNECLRWAEERFGHENILQWNTHFDEKTPHLHILFAPIIRDPDIGNKYSSSEFLGGKEGLKETQSEFFKYISSKKYALSRGEEGSKKKHSNQSEWKSELIKKERALEKESEIIDMKKKFIAEKTSEIEEREKEVNKKDQNILFRETMLKTEEQRLKNRISAQEEAEKNRDDGEKIHHKILTEIKNQNPTIPEVKNFWGEFLKRLPEIIKGIFDEIKNERKEPEKIASRIDAIKRKQRS